MPATERSQPRLHPSIHIGLLAALLLATVALVVDRPAGVSAQSATPVAAAACADPGLVPAPNVPAAVTESTPAASPAAVTGVDQATSDAISAVIDSLAACLTAGNPETVAAARHRPLSGRCLRRRRAHDQRGLHRAGAAGAGCSGDGRLGRSDRIHRQRYRHRRRSSPFRATSSAPRSGPSSSAAAARPRPPQPPAARATGWSIRSRCCHSTAPAGASEADAELQDGAITITPDTVEGPDVVVTVQNTERGDTRVPGIAPGRRRHGRRAHPPDQRSTSRPTSNSSARKPCPPVKPARSFSSIWNQAPTRWSACSRTKTACPTWRSEKPPPSPWSKHSPQITQQQAATAVEAAPLVVRLRLFPTPGK